MSELAIKLISTLLKHKEAIKATDLMKWIKLVRNFQIKDFSFEFIVLDQPSRTDCSQMPRYHYTPKVM